MWSSLATVLKPCENITFSKYQGSHFLSSVESKQYYCNGFIDFNCTRTTFIEQMPPFPVSKLSNKKRAADMLLQWTVCGGKTLLPSDCLPTMAQLLLAKRSTVDCMSVAVLM